jgi:hypothetical protein
MKIKFESLPKTGEIKISFDGGVHYTDYNVSDIESNGGVDIRDPEQDLEKIKIMGPANVLKNLKILTGIKLEGAGRPNFIIDNSYESFPDCVTGIVLPDGIVKLYAAFAGGSPEDMVTPFYTYTNLKKVVIPESVTEIGDSVFSDCHSLENVNIPNNVTTIGDYAFHYCTGLTNIDIPNNVTSIGNFAFAECGGLTGLNIPDGVTSIGERAFSGCTGLTSITIPENVTTIGNSAFQDCTNLTSLTIPSSVTTIGEGAFYNCTGLTEINIPEGVTTIGNSAFQDCTGLTEINIPDSVTIIGEGAFSGCPLTTIHISPETQARLKFYTRTVSVQ